MAEISQGSQARIRDRRYPWKRACAASARRLRSGSPGNCRPSGTAPPTLPVPEARSTSRARSALRVGLQNDLCGCTDANQCEDSFESFAFPLLRVQQVTICKIDLYRFKFIQQLCKHEDENRCARGANEYYRHTKFSILLNLRKTNIRKQKEN